MPATSARLLRLLSLLQAHRDWSGADLAERLGVTPRTVRRDVGRLRELGYPVHASPGTGGGYQLGAGAALPPLLLDDEEAVAVAVVLRTAAGGGLEGVAETSLRALAKLEQVLPARLRRRVEAFTSFTVPMVGERGGRGGPTVGAAVLTELAFACRDRERVRFDYRDHEGREGRRTVEPHRLVFTEHRWYLVAWDVDRRDWRTFRVDRLTPRPPHGPRFEPRRPPAEDLAGYVARGVSTAAYDLRAVVLLHAPLEEAAARVTPMIGTLEAVDEHTCLLRTGAHGPEAMVAHLAVLGFDFEIREPAGLRERLAPIAARLNRSCGVSPD